MRRDRGTGRLAGDDRAVSVTLDYALTLVIATLVVTALFVTAGEFVADQREQVIRTELQVVGQHVASDVERADRLSVAGSGAETVVVNASLPDRVSGDGYAIDVSSSGWINLSSDPSGVAVSVRVDTKTPLRDGAVSGGDLAVVYDGGELEVVS